MEIFCQFNLFYAIFMQNIKKKHFFKTPNFLKKQFSLTVMLTMGYTAVSQVNRNFLDLFSGWKNGNCTVMLLSWHHNNNFLWNYISIMTTRQQSLCKQILFYFIFLSDSRCRPTQGPSTLYRSGIYQAGEWHEIYSLHSLPRGAQMFNVTPLLHDSPPPGLTPAPK